MRVGITFHAFDPYLSGVDYYTLGLIRALLRLTHLSVVVFTNASDLLSQHISSHSNLSIRSIPTLRHRIHRIFWEHTLLPQLARKERLDLLHCPCYICPVFPIPVPCVVTVHDTIALDHPRWCKPSNALYYRFALKPALRRADHIIAVSQNTSEDIRRHVPDLAHKISVNSPGIDPIFHQVASAAKRYQVMRRYHLPRRFLLVVGNLEPKKNHLNILKAYQILRRRNFPAKLVIVGKRCWKIKVQLKKSLTYFPPGDICFTGYVARADLPAIYQLAELFLFPSLYEGFGFPALEAMASRLPVIASDRGALAETLAGGAYTVNPHSPAQIADAVCRLSAESHLREHYIQRGHQRCQPFNWKNTTDQILKIYRRVINAKENRLYSNHLAVTHRNLRCP